jgi:tetratricopeptide (TPR) repeat protein
MLETVHEYAWEQLRESGEADLLQRRHSRYWAQLSVALERTGKHGQVARWLNRLDAEQDNLRAAIRCALDQGAANDALRLAYSLRTLIEARGSLREGVQWQETVLAQNQDADPVMRAEALAGAAFLHLQLGNSERARSLAIESQALYRAAGNFIGIARATVELAVALGNLGQRAQAVVLLEENLVEVRALDDKWLLFRYLNVLGRLDDERRGQRFQEALEVARKAGLPHAEALALGNLGGFVLSRGEVERALGLFRESLRLCGQHRLQRVAGVPMVGLVSALVAQAAPPDRIARMVGAAAALHEAIGTDLPSEQYAETGAARAQLGEGRWMAAWAEGRAMSIEQAIAYAMESSECSPQ